jgi:hypothetical protein
MYLKILKGFEKYYGSDVVLLLQRTLYGTKQAALQFWRELLKSLARCSIKEARLIHVYFSSEIKTRNLASGFCG